MRKPKSMAGLETLGRVRLSPSFFMRDMLYSEISNFYGIANIPDDPELAVLVGTKFCTELLEPLQEQFGRISIRSAYRSPEVNGFGNANGLKCASNEANFSRHIWDKIDGNGHMGAMATIVVNAAIPYYDATKDWQALAWWIHDNLPYSSLFFFPKLCAFNISWHEMPKKRIESWMKPRLLTKLGMSNQDGSHKLLYKDLLAAI